MTTTENLLTSLRGWTIPKKATHPGLYFSKEDVPGLRAKAAAYSAVFQPLVDKIEERLKDPEIKGRTMGAEELAFVYAITGEERYADAAKEAVWAILSEPDWVALDHKPLRVDLIVARTARVLAEVYDELYDVLSAEERARIREGVIERALNLFLEIVRDQSEWWTGSQNNWRSVICGEMGIAALCMREHYPDVRECVEWALKGVLSLLDLVGQDGGYYEGVGYWGYGIGEAVRFGEILRRVSDGAVDLFDHPYLKVAGDFGLYCTTGDGGSFNFGDSRYDPANPTLMAKLAAQYQNSSHQWHAENYPLKDVYGFLWMDPELKAERPSDKAGSKHFRDVGVAVMRSGWEEKDTFVGLKSGWSTGGHCHLDINSIVLNALGERLISDYGGWTYAHYHGFFDYRGGRWRFEGNQSVAHNTLLVDGHGQTYGMPEYGDRYSWKKLGYIQRFYTSETYDYVVGDASRAYGDLLGKFIRYVALVKGNNPYVVILDDLKSNPARTFEGRLHHLSDEVEIGDGFARLKKGDAVLDIRFADASGPVGWHIADVKKLSTYDGISGRASGERRYISYEPFRKILEGQLVTVLVPRPASESGETKVEVTRNNEDPDQEKIVTVKVDTGCRSDTLRFDLADWQEGGTVVLDS
ncbi:MAG: heparinase II/III family protein [Candidatus Latescibacteria bacterium]|nr:heparinase II/III family protein [Candidatus Latescibacterota bacterium]